MTWRANVDTALTVSRDATGAPDWGDFARGTVGKAVRATLRGLSATDEPTTSSLAGQEGSFPPPAPERMARMVMQQYKDLEPVIERGTRALVEEREAGMRFPELLLQWREETCFTSSLADMVMHPAYQQLIGLGKPAIPLILEELREGPDHLFWALYAITGEDPVPADARGDIQRMTEAWLEWGSRNGYDERIYGGGSYNTSSPGYGAEHTA